MKRVCLGLPSLDERGDKWPIDRDVAQAVYTVKSSPDHVWSNPYIHPPHSVMKALTAVEGGVFLKL